MESPRTALLRRTYPCAGRFRKVLDDGFDALKSKLLEEFCHQLNSASTSDKPDINAHISDAPDCQMSVYCSTASSSPTNRTKASFCLPDFPTDTEQPQQTAKCLVDLDAAIERPDGSRSVATPLLIPSLPRKGGHTRSVQARWADLTARLTRPMMRNFRMKERPRLVMHDCWSQCLSMLKKGDELYLYELSKATVSIMDGRLKERDNRWPTKGSSSLMQALGTFVHDSNNLRLFMVKVMSCGSCRAIHPDSKLRILWLFLSLVFLVHDASTIPFAVFFDTEFSSMSYTRWMASIFWLCDVGMSFITGRYVDGQFHLRFGRIARQYARSWFLFDFAVVVSDWLLLILQLVLGVSFFGRRRSLRFLRLLQLIRLGKFNLTLRTTLATNPLGLILYFGMVKTGFAYIAFVHFTACLWYGIGRGDDIGWARRNAMYGPHRVWLSYWTAVRWALSLIHGTYQIPDLSAVELAFSALAFWIGFMLNALFIAKTTHAVSRLDTSHMKETMMRFAMYARRHNISGEVAYRAQQYLASVWSKGNVMRQIQQDNDLSSMFPQSLREEILSEGRRPILKNALFLKELEWTSCRTIRQICVEALHGVTASQDEMVFSSMEACTCMRFVESGKLVYYIEECQLSQQAYEDFFHSAEVGSGHRSVSHSTSTDSTYSDWATDISLSKLVRQMHGFSAVGQGASLSEGVLWTTWRHRGNLVGVKDSILLELELAPFHAVLVSRIAVCLVAARCAQSFVRYANQQTVLLNDLLTYDPAKFDSAMIDDHAGRDSHLIFLSHYKEESGTEATLLQGTLAQLLERDNKEYGDSPVFLDSEYLTDLSTLAEHVSNSHSIVFLLSPGVLYRPWCLMEIATAFKHGKLVVPVEIQRPGMKFEFPSQEFFSLLAHGQLLSRQDWDALRNQGISQQELEEAIRHVFQQIVVPFSPHRSHTIRAAELKDIIKRCKIDEVMWLEHGSLSVQGMTTEAGGRRHEKRTSSL